MEFLRELILRLVGVGILSAVVLNILPEGSLRKAAAFACGLVMAAVLLGSLEGAELESYRPSLGQYRQMAREVTEDAGAEGEKLLRDSIERGCEEYILDKGRELGLEAMEVSVQARWSEEDKLWYCDSVAVQCDCDAVTKYRLQQYILSEFGVGFEEQEWSGET